MSGVKPESDKSETNVSRRLLLQRLAAGSPSRPPPRAATP